MKITINKTNISLFKEILSDALKQKKSKDIFIYYPLSNKVSSVSHELFRYKEIKFFDFLLYFNQFSDIHLIGFPLCILPDRDFSIFVDPYEGKFIKKCSACKEKSNCWGIPSVYLDKFGDSEFKPFIEKDYLLIRDWKKDKEKIKKIWDIERERQLKIWQYYFKNIKGKILDAGAGIGVFLSFSPGRIIGIEKDKEKVYSFIRSIKKIDLRQGDITHLDLRTNYFNAVYCHFVLEHLSLKKSIIALKEMKRVLKRKGKLFVMVASKDELETWHDVGHENIFTKKKLDRLAKETNFKKYKIFNERFLEKYKEFNFDLNIKDNHKKKVALCLIAEK